jgi:hypothetical protein
MVIYTPRNIRPFGRKKGLTFLSLAKVDSRIVDVSDPLRKGHISATLLAWKQKTLKVFRNLQGLKAHPITAVTLSAA